VTDQGESFVAAKKKPPPPPPDMPPREKKVLAREEGTYQGPYFEPAVDIWETDSALCLAADIPGVPVDRVSVDLRDNLLTLTARVTPPDPRWKTRYEEYRLGHFMRQFRLGQDIDQAGISAQVQDGVLHLTLPKARAGQPRRITVKVSD
jgi:HSP20 family protein